MRSGRAEGHALRWGPVAGRKDTHRNPRKCAAARIRQSLDTVSVPRFAMLLNGRVWGLRCISFGPSFGPMSSGPIAVWARHAFDGQRVVHLLGSQHALTDKTEPVTRFAQISGKPDALIEDKTRAAEMSATAVFEILQNASIELEHLVESILNQEGSRLLATNAAGAEGNDGVRLILLQEFRRGSRELAKVFNTDRYGAFKRAQSNFKIVPYVEQRERPAFVEPLFELAGCQSGRWRAPGKFPPRQMR